MSWAEVKKINSNLSKPLDEILNDSTSGLNAIKNLATNIKNNTEALMPEAQAFKITNTSGTPTTSTPVTLTISGTGKLYGMTLTVPAKPSSSTNTKTRAIITIDNKTILDYSVHATESTSTYDGTAWLLFTTPDLISVTSSSSSDLSYRIITMHTLFANVHGSNVQFNLPLLGQTQSSPDTVKAGYSIYRFGFLTNPIPFNNCSVQVKAISANLTSSAAIFALYTLD